MLVSMSATEWSEVDVAELPAGTVTLLLADVEGSTQLWEKQQEVMTAAELTPIRLRFGVHTGDVQLRDEGNYAGQTINKTARLRDLAHGGQTVLSGVTEDLVEDQLPDDAWLTDLGRHGLRDLRRPVRVSQLCHPDLRNDFPPLRTANVIATHNLPAQLTSFVGRVTQITEISNFLGDDRLITLTGAGGAGKTRLAIEVAGKMGGSFPDGICYADLAPITHPDMLPLTVARALRSPTSRVARSRRRCCDPSATDGCCWCWTTASVCWRPAPNWSTTCLPAARVGLTARARAKIACGESRSAEADLHEALAAAARTDALSAVPEAFEGLAQLASAAGGHHEAARLLGVADSLRLRMQRGRGERKRPSSGWESLTPTELDVVRLVAEGIPNKDIAIRLFVSPRTVQSHLRHVFNKLALTSRVQLAQEAARRS
jgi:DNA-binding CsgD family transcriptional regulator